MIVENRSERVLPLVSHKPFTTDFIEAESPVDSCRQASPSPTIQYPPASDQKENMHAGK